MDKAVILAAGLGTRMRRADARVVLTERQADVADTGVKALIPIDRPFLDYLLSNIADAGYRRVCLVIGPGHEVLRDYCRSRSGGRLDLETAVQERPLGTANAVAAASDFTGEDSFLLVNSDNYYPTAALKALRELDGCGLIGFESRALVASGLIRAERLAAFAAIAVDDHSLLTGIVEKPPSLGPDALVSMNCWRFAPAIHVACRCIEASPRGEFEIPDAVSYSMRQLGQQYRVVTCTEPVLDMSSRDDVEAVSQFLRGRKVEL